MNQLDFAACRITARWRAILRPFGLPVGHLEAVNVTRTQSGALRYNPPVIPLPPTVLCLDDCPQKSCPCLILCKRSNAMCACRSLDFFGAVPSSVGNLQMYYQKDNCPNLKSSEEVGAMLQYRWLCLCLYIIADYLITVLYLHWSPINTSRTTPKIFLYTRHVEIRQS